MSDNPYQKNKRSIKELQYMQAMPLNIKVALTKSRIREWVEWYGEDGVYVSFSGGKDSTVLLDIVRSMYPNVRAMFVDVPTQYPELKEFVQTFDNVDIVKPKMSFFEVCEKYGFPLISKEVSECVRYAREYLARALSESQSLQTDRQMNFYAICDLLGIDRRSPEGKATYREMKKAKGIPSEILENAPARFLQLLGRMPHKEKGVLTNEYSKRYDKSKYKFFLEADFSLSSECCKVMKKKPAHEYAKKTHRVPMTAQMADESMLRTEQWLKNGCNGFNMKSPISNPMSFWSEQDVLLYIKIHNLPICSVYGDVVVDDGTQVEGQTNVFEMYGEMEIFEKERPILKTTGCSRTGCVLCGFGCHLEKEGEGRFEKLRETHPQWYKMLDVAKNNGVTFREAIEWTNEHGNLNIKL